MSNIKNVGSLCNLAIKLSFLLQKGLGAQRVKKDFGEIESRALQVDKEREELAKNVVIQESKNKEEQDKQMWVFYAIDH